MYKLFFICLTFITLIAGAYYATLLWLFGDFRTLGEIPTVYLIKVVVATMYIGGVLSLTKILRD